MEALFTTCLKVVDGKNLILWSDVHVTFNEQGTIGHFQLPFASVSKWVLQNHYMGMCLSPFPIQVDFHVSQTHFCMKGLVKDEYWNTGTR